MITQQQQQQPMHHNYEHRISVTRGRRLDKTKILSTCDRHPFIDSAGCSLLTDVGRRISRATNDPRQTSYIFQQNSVTIIRGNAQPMTSSLRRYAGICLMKNCLITIVIVLFCKIVYYSFFVRLCVLLDSNIYVFLNGILSC